MARKWMAALAAAIIMLPGVALSEPFRFIRIGDADGFGFTDTSQLVRALPGRRGVPADTNGDGVLGEGEFMPDLNHDGGVAWTSQDNFDNRSPEEVADRAVECEGCLSIGRGTMGSNWTDLALSASAPNVNWPDRDGPRPPNNAIFVFDFKVAGNSIARGSEIFFNLVFGDYDIDPALVGVQFRNGRRRVLSLANQGPLDGLIQGRSAVLAFDDVFTSDGEGNWEGLVRVIFLAPADPYTAFDYVELSVFGLVTASAQAPRAGGGVL